MNTNFDYLDREIQILRDNDRTKTEFCISVSSNVEKLTISQQNLSKRLDDIIENTALMKKDIDQIKVSEAKRQERITFINLLIKLWPLYLSVIIFAFCIGLIIDDITVIKTIFGK